jgi:hypothetical protein
MNKIAAYVINAVDGEVERLMQSMVGLRYKMWRFIKYPSTPIRPGKFWTIASTLGS